MFHHLPHNEKLRTLREARRVLKPGGSLHLLDFERKESPGHNPLARWNHSSPHMQDHTRERLHKWMLEAGLTRQTTPSSDEVIFGKILHFVAGTEA